MDKRMIKNTDGGQMLTRMLLRAVQIARLMMSPQFLSVFCIFLYFVFLILTRMLLGFDQGNVSDDPRKRKTIYDVAV